MLYEHLPWVPRAVSLKLRSPPDTPGKFVANAGPWNLLRDPRWSGVGLGIYILTEELSDRRVVSKGRVVQAEVRGQIAQDCDLALSDLELRKCPCTSGPV